MSIDLPEEDSELIEVLENIDYVVAERARAGFKPELVGLLASLRTELEAILWADAGIARDIEPVSDRSRSST